MGRSGGRAMRRVAVFVVGAVIASVLAVLQSATPAHAHHQFLWFDDFGTDEITVGPNSGVYIYMGAVEFHEDFIFPTADVYVVSGVPGDGGGLSDASGAPNTVLGLSGGLIIDELIAVTKPGGTLGEGTYSVVYDEGQDGKYNADVDAVFPDAITVEFPPGEIPALSPALAQLKADSGVQAAHWITMTTLLDTYEQLSELQATIECIAGGLATCAVSTLIDKLKEAAIDALMESLGLVDPKVAARDVVNDLTSHYLGIKADPPDPNFDTVTPLGEVETIQPLEATPLEGASVDLGNAVATDAALAEALLHSLERYQGADAANDPAWARAHALAIQQYAGQLATHLATTNAALDDLKDAVTGDGTDFDTVAEIVEPVRARIEASGFTDEERATLRNRGLSDADIAALRTTIGADDFSGFTESAFVDAIETTKAQNAASVPHLQSLASAMDDFVFTIESDPGFAAALPTADAGGPYTVDQGAPVTLNGSGSSDPGGALTAHEWDLDRDGQFDDATGPSPNVTFPAPFEGLIGLRVTDGDGNQAVDYAAVTVNDTNAVPAITGHLPEAVNQQLEPGDSQEFSVTTSDDDGDGVTVEWLLDGVVVGTGPSFTYSPDQSDLGVHTLRARASDGVATNASTVFDWAASVVMPDGDGDGWSSDVDCDDGDAAVNPAQPEEQGNGKDDDCDPGTTDAVVNDPPAAKPVSTGTAEDTPVDVALVGTDPEGDPLTFAIASDPVNGTLSPVAGGTVTYTPDPNFTGTDSFTFTASDAEFTSAAATVTINVAAVADQPVAFDVGASTDEDEPVAVTLNATDPDADPLTYSIVDGPDHGGLGPVSGNTVTYTPTAQYNGTDSFTYKVNDGTADSNTATVSLEVVPVNDAPVATDTAAATPEDVPVAVPLPATDVDGDVLSFLIVDDPEHGSLSAPAAGSVTYTPEPNFSGDDSFTFKAFDGNAASSVATATLTVNPVNDVPTADDVEAATGEDQPVVIAMQGHDVEGSPLTYSIVDAPTHGTLSSVSGRRVTYTPSAEYSGPDSVTYKVNDGTADSNTATVTLDVLVLNDAPVAIDDAAAAPNNAPVVVDVRANDTDIDGGPLHVVALDAPAEGSAVLQPDGNVKVTPPYNFEGTLNVDYTVSDGNGGTDAGTLTVLATPGGPVAHRTFTADGQFGDGAFQNVVQSGPNRLRLDDIARGTNRFWVAVSTRGTVVKFDIDTGQILGEYWTSPDGQPKDPSRTTVDQSGNVWATNRAGNSVVNVGQVETGTCVDRNGNGVIDTSSGQGDIKTWNNAGGVDTDGGVQTAMDECILHYVRVSASGTRHVAVTPDNDIWVTGHGSTNQGVFNLIHVDDVDDNGDGDTADIVRTEGAVGYGGYGGLIDGNGVIWSARRLLRWDTANPLSGPNGGNWRGYEHDSYGLCIDNDGNVFNTELGSNTRKFAPDGTLLATFPHGAGAAQGCVVDDNGDLWVAHSLLGQTTVGHLKNDGTFVGNVVVSSGPTGVAVDANGKIWSTNYNAGNVTRIDPNAGAVGADGETPIGAVDFTSVNLAGNPYNYSDMTGSTLQGPPRIGTWAAVFDSGEAGADWAGLTFTATTPGDSDVSVLVASSEDGTTFGAPQEVASGDPLPVAAGRYLRVVAQLTRATGGDSPLLADLTAWTAPPGPPTANPDETSTPEDTPVPVTLTGSPGEADPVEVDGASVAAAGDLTFEIIGEGPAHGELSDLSGDTATYTPDPNFHGTDNFYFRVDDGSRRSEFAQFDLTVTPVNDPPVADDKTVTVRENTPRSIPLTGSDLDGDDLTFDIADPPDHGTLSNLQNGAVTYTPDRNYNGPDSFTYTADDGGGGVAVANGGGRLVAAASPAATVSITVTPVNAAPTAKNVRVTTDAGDPVRVTLRGSDSDGDPLTYAIVSGPARGSLSALSGNKVTYRPRAGFAGSDTFRYRVNDGTVGSNVATVTVVVEAVLGGAIRRPDYRMSGGDGGVFAFGGSSFLGTAGVRGTSRAAAVTAPSFAILNAPIVAIAHTPDDRGYWLLGGDGGVFAFRAPFRGSLASLPLNRPVVDMAVTPSGNGYIIVTDEGGVFAFGDAPFKGSLVGLALQAPVVAVQMTPSGNGYWLATADGGLFAFGDAKFFGSLAGRPLGGSIVDMVAHPKGTGVWLVTGAGAVYPLGAVRSFGSLAGVPLNSPVVGIAARSTGKGYWLASADGGAFAFGDAPFRGALAGGTSSTPGPGCCSRLNRPITDIGS